MTYSETGTELVSRLDIAEIRKDFPVFSKPVADKELIFLDSASSSQKPAQVIEAMATFSAHSYANVHRGAYALSHKSSAAMEQVRVDIAQFIRASDAREIVFTKNATEALNLVAASWGRANLKEGDAIALSVIEHHANIVPWQIWAEEIGYRLRYLELGPDGYLDYENLEEVLDGVKLLSITAMSNVTGEITPLEKLIDVAHKAGALVCVDASQLVPHSRINVSELGADFVTFTGHKMCGPTGVGVLWARAELLEEMPVFLGGGAMISTVSRTGFTPAPIPAKFEAGTPPIIEIIGLGAAIKYLENIGIEDIEEHSRYLSQYFLAKAQEIPEAFRIQGPATRQRRGSVFSFDYKGIHPHDLSQVLDSCGVSVRAGHHCAKPLMSSLGVAATTRASMYLYNTTDDIDKLFEALTKADDYFLN